MIHALRAQHGCRIAISHADGAVSHPPLHARSCMLARDGVPNSSNCTGLSCLKAIHFAKIGPRGAPSVDSARPRPTTPGRRPRRSRARTAMRAAAARAARQTSNGGPRSRTRQRSSVSRGAGILGAPRPSDSSNLG
jgi:hypothetical protein